MNFGQIKSEIVSWAIGLSDIQSIAGTLVNMALHDIEKDRNWRWMQSIITGSLTTSSDNFDEPANYKETIAFFITDSNKEVELRKYSYHFMLLKYPDDSTSPSKPKAFAMLNNASGNAKIYFRPWADQSYNYTHIYHKFSNDFSNDSDTHWLLTNAWEVLLFGALKHAEKFTRTNDEDVKRWTDAYNENFSKLDKMKIDEEIAGSARLNNNGMQVI